MVTATELENLFMYMVKKKTNKTSLFVFNLSTFGNLAFEISLE